VFLNVPYDKQYAPLFVALIAGLVALGWAPRCALEARGRARLEDPFNPFVFRQLVASAFILAQEKGFIA
jgi:hypothetical protein